MNPVPLISMLLVFGIFIAGFILGWGSSIFVAWLIAKNRTPRD